MTEPPFEQCDCGRWLLEEGPRKRVEAAWDKSHIAQAVAWMQSFPTGAWRKKREAQLADLAIRLEDYCAQGTLQVPRELNKLTEEIWEIKAGTLRLPFFDVPDSTNGSVRATHGFTKNSERTPPHEIRRAEGIMREDLKQ